MSVLASTFNRFRVPSLFRAPCRALHSAASYAYLKIWKNQKVDYVGKMQRENMQHSPHLIERVLKVESAMKRDGFTSFVHAAPAGSAVLRSAYEASYGKQRFFQFLRPKDLRYAVPWQRAARQKPKAGDQSQKGALLSMSYALTSGIKSCESAASWGFLNHFGAESNFALLDEYEAFLDTAFKGREETKKYFREKGWNLIRLYGRLKAGDFIVVGVPKRAVSKYVYDSLPYNVPTGKSVTAVANAPQVHRDTLMEGGHIATMFVCNETLDPASGIVMVKANDTEEVNAFCQKKTFKPMDKIPLFQEMFRFQHSSFEREEEERRNTADKELAQLSQELREAILKPDKVFNTGEVVTSWDTSDFVPLAF